VLLSSGYIAGGTIAGIVAALLLLRFKELAEFGPGGWGEAAANNWTTVIAFGLLCVVLLWVGSRRDAAESTH